MTDQIQGKLHAHIDYTRAVLRERDQLLAQIAGWKAEQKENLKNQCDLHEENRELRKELAELRECNNILYQRNANLFGENSELRLQVISDIGQEIDAEPNEWKEAMLDGLAHYSIDAPVDMSPVLILNLIVGTAIAMALDPEVSDLVHPKAEPVAWMGYSPTKGNGYKVFLNKHLADNYSMDVTPLYAAPQDGLRKELK